MTMNKMPQKTKMKKSPRRDTTMTDVPFLIKPTNALNRKASLQFPSVNRSHAVPHIATVRGYDKQINFSRQSLPATIRDTKMLNARNAQAHQKLLASTMKHITALERILQRNGLQTVTPVPKNDGNFSIVQLPSKLTDLIPFNLNGRKSQMQQARLQNGLQSSATQLSSNKPTLAVKKQHTNVSLTDRTISGKKLLKPPLSSLPKRNTQLTLSLNDNDTLPINRLPTTTAVVGSTATAPITAANDRASVESLPAPVPANLLRRQVSAKTWKTWRNVDESDAYDNVEKYIEENELMSPEKSARISRWIEQVQQTAVDEVERPKSVKIKQYAK